MLITATAYSCSDGEGSGVPSPTISANLAGSQLNVEVSVPAGHHAYLDSGKEGNLIPVTFDFTNLGTELKEVSRPQGTVEEISGAKILKGNGVFVFESESSLDSDSSFRVRTQICDDTSGICYRPQWHDVSL